MVTFESKILRPNKPTDLQNAIRYALMELLQTSHFIPNQRDILFVAQKAITVRVYGIFTLCTIRSQKVFEWEGIKQRRNTLPHPLVHEETDAKLTFLYSFFKKKQQKKTNINFGSY